MARGGIEITRHFRVLPDRKADAVVSIVAGLIVDYLESGRAGGDAAGCDNVSMATRVTDTQEVQK